MRTASPRPPRCWVAPRRRAVGRRSWDLEAAGRTGASRTASLASTVSDMADRRAERARPVPQAQDPAQAVPASRQRALDRVLSTTSRMTHELVALAHRPSPAAPLARRGGCACAPYESEEAF